MIQTIKQRSHHFADASISMLHIIFILFAFHQGSLASRRVVRLCLSVLSALAPVVPPLLRLRPAGLPLASQVYSLIYRCAVRTHTLAPALRQFSSLVQVP
ncbi:unnamed protein product [Tilletia laevis]|uniref:Uncharacterized protein n=1 Tax=Tilletia laevis TaxID=157183 RepID=A0A9N8LRI2_9BASI|nr:unnamed protein product [Tilletia laevis]